MPAPASDTTVDYLHREVSYAYARRDLAFAIGNSLFSRGGVDSGTRTLLTTLDRRPGGQTGDARENPASILDLGCGWGAMTVALAARYPEAQVVGVDRDLLAVHFTRANIARNEVGNATALPSLGYAALKAGDQPFAPAQFDWIVSNLPAKVGENGLRALLFGAGELLKPGGMLAVVFVSPLLPQMQMYIAELSDVLTVETAYELKRAEHIVWHLRLPDGLPGLYSPEMPLMPGAGFASETEADALMPWLRDDVLEPTDGAPHIAVHNLAEFDTIDHRTRLVGKVAASTAAPPDAGGERILVANPRHGFLARLLMRERRPSELLLVDRDLLALRVAERNLALLRESDPSLVDVTVRAVAGLALGARDRHDGDPVSGPFDLIAADVNADEGRNGLRRMLQEAGDLLGAEGVAILGMTAAELTTLLKPAGQNLHFRFGRTMKRRGYAAQLLRPPKEAREQQTTSG